MEDSTIPDLFAFKVWSLPMVTLSPGYQAVPLCRKIISPALTDCVGNTLKPNLLPGLSDLFLVLPPDIRLAIFLHKYKIYLNLSALIKLYDGHSHNL